MRKGDLFLADEISLADDSVLERLNSLLGMCIHMVTLCSFLLHVCGCGNGMPILGMCIHVITLCSFLVCACMWSRYAHSWCVHLYSNVMLILGMCIHVITLSSFLVCACVW
jgi:hypothetical protein